jgi:hypothetical protein
MAGPINLKLLTDFFNEIDPERTFCPGGYQPSAGRAGRYLASVVPVPASVPSKIARATPTIAR